MARYARTHRWLACLALSAWLQAGCAARPASAPGVHRPSTTAAEQLEPRWVEPGEIPADVSQVGAFDALDRPPKLADETTLRYRALSEGDTQCVAAAHAPAANLLESQRRSLAKNCGNQPPSCGNALRREALALAAQDERNRAAGAALKAHYLLMEAHAGQATLEDNVKVLDYLLAGAAELKEQGIRLDTIEPGSLNRQRLELLEKRTELALSVAQLNAQLRERLGISPDQLDPFWPEADLTVSVVPIDLDLAIHEGLSGRADLAMLDLLARKLSADSLSAADAVLSAVNPALAGATPKITFASLLFPCRSGQCDAASRRRQLRELHAERKRQAEREIRLAVETIGIRVEQVALAKEHVLAWNERVSQIQTQQEAAGGAKRFELGAAKLSQQKAESDLMHQVIAWKLAHLELRQAQGKLAHECPSAACLPKQLSPLTPSPTP